MPTRSLSRALLAALLVAGSPVPGEAGGVHAAAQEAGGQPADGPKEAQGTLAGEVAALEATSPPAPVADDDAPTGIEIRAAVFAYRRAHAEWDGDGRRGRHPAREAYPLFEDLVGRGWEPGRLWLLEQLDQVGFAPSDERRRRRDLVDRLLAVGASAPSATLERALLEVGRHPNDFQRSEVEPRLREALSARADEPGVQAAGLVALGALLRSDPDPTAAPEGGGAGGGGAAQSGPVPAEQLWRGVLASHPETSAAALAADLLLVEVDRRYRVAADAWVARWLSAEQGDDPGQHPATATWSEVEALAEAGSGRALWWMAREIRHLALEPEALAARRLQLLDRLIAEHTDAPWLAEAVQFSEVIVTDLGRAAVRRLGEGLLENSRDPRLRAWVLHGMATIVAVDESDPLGPEKAIALLERLQAEYPEDRLAEAAASWLFALRHLRPGLIPPPREALDGEGNPIGLADLRGGVALLVFWGYWSPIASADLDRLTALATSYADRPLTLLGINSDDDPEGARTEFAAAGHDWRNVWEGRRSGPWTQSWHIRNFPTYFLLDAEGRIVATDQDLSTLEPLIESTVAAAESAE